MASHEVHEAYRSIQGWHRDQGPLQSKPLFEDLQRLSLEYESLYARHPLVGHPLLVEVDPYVISDEIPSEDEIRVALHRLRKRRAAGPSRMKVESLLGWETSNPEAWKRLVGIVQESSLGFEVPTAYSQAILVLIPKSEAGFRGVTLLEVLYKLWGMIVYRRASKVIQFHPDIHGFHMKHFDPDSGPTYRARKLAKVQCPYCSHAVSNQYLPTYSSRAWCTSRCEY